MIVAWTTVTWGLIEGRLSITFKSNGKRDLYHVTKFSLCLSPTIHQISTHELVVSRNLLSIRILWAVFIGSFFFLRNSQLKSLENVPFLRAAKLARKNSWGLNLLLENITWSNRLNTATPWSVSPNLCNFVTIDRHKKELVRNKYSETRRGSWDSFRLFVVFARDLWHSTSSRLLCSLRFGLQSFFCDSLYS